MEPMNFCPQCGHPVRAASRFCGKCGGALATLEAVDTSIDGGSEPNRRSHRLLIAVAAISLVGAGALGYAGMSYWNGSTREAKTQSTLASPSAGTDAYDRAIGLGAASPAVARPVGEGSTVGTIHTAQWANNRADAQRSGRSQFVLPATTPRILWTYNPGLRIEGTGRGRYRVCGGSSQALSSLNEPLIAADGTIYLAMPHGIVTLDQKGQRKWVSQLAADLVIGALATDGTVFAGSFKVTEGAQISIAAEVASIGPDGVSRWRRDLGRSFIRDIVVASNDRLYVTDQFGIRAFAAAAGSPVYAVPDQAEKQPPAAGQCPSPVAVSSDGSQYFLLVRGNGPEQCSAALTTVDSSGRVISSSVVQEWQWDRCEPWNAHLAWVSAIPSGGAYARWEQLATSPAMIGGVLRERGNLSSDEAQLVVSEGGVAAPRFIGNADDKYRWLDFPPVVDPLGAAYFGGPYRDGQNWIGFRVGRFGLGAASTSWTKSLRERSSQLAGPMVMDKAGHIVAVLREQGASRFRLVSIKTANPSPTILWELEIPESNPQFTATMSIGDGRLYLWTNEILYALGWE